MDVTNIIGKLRDIPRAAAITEGQKRRPGTRPPNTTRTEPQDYDFIQVQEFESAGLWFITSVQRALAK